MISIRVLILFSLTVSLTSFITACDDIIGSDDPEIEAVIIIEDSAPPIGIPVILDASQSVFEGNEPVFSWSMEPPAGSSASIEAPSSEVTSFIPDVEGDYIVTLTVSAEGVEDSQTVTIAAGSGDVVISNDIREDMVFFSANRYIITDNIRVNDARLVIQPGTEIRFDQGAGLRIDSDGILEADGTVDEPILFTATSQSRGWWDGLYFVGTTHPHNLLNHVIIEYGGGDAQHSSTEPANLTISRSLSGNAASVTLTNSILRHSGGFGLFLHANGSMPESGPNIYTENADGPAAVDAARLNYLNHISSFSGNDNGNNVVRVIGNTVEGNVRWQSLDVPYFVTGDVTVSDSEFTIDPGATFYFDAETGFRLRSGAEFTITGTQEDPITFTASEQTPGWWNGVWVVATTHPNNVMEHVIIEYGGREEFHSSTNPANLTVSRSLSSNAASLTLKNSVLRNGAGLGLYLHDNGSLPNSMANTMTGNAGGPAMAFTSGAHYFDAASSFSGNGANNFVWIEGNTLDESVTWQALVVPYGMMGDSRVEDNDFAIEPGARLYFDLNSGLDLRGDISFTIKGTPEDPIVFTGMEKSAGWWKGIFITESQQPNNEMEHVIIEYGGSNAWHSSVEPANLTLGRSLSSNNARMTLGNSSLRFSDGHGLYVHEGSQINNDVCEVNEFQGNAADGCIVME